MIYPYKCENCEIDFEVVRHHSKYNPNEKCPDCDKPSIRIFTPPQVPKVEKHEYNPAFGCVVKGKRHRNELAKQRGLIEVGNESLSSLHKSHEKTKQEKLDNNWKGVI